MTSVETEQRTLPLVLLTLGLVIAASIPLYLTGALAVQMRRELDFGVAALGVAVAGYRMIGAFTAPRIGRLVDRFGPVPAMRAAIGVSITTSLGIALLARNWWTLAGFLAFGGCANPLAQSGANLSLVRTVRDGRQGIAFALKQSALPGASAIAGLAVPAIAVRFGWRSAFVAAAVAGLALVPALPSSTDTRFQPSGEAAPTTFATTRSLIVLTIGFFFAMSAASTLSTFTVDSAVSAGISPGRAGLLLTLGSVAAIATRLIAGAVADRNEGDGLMAIAGMLVAGCLGYTLLAMQQTWSIPVGVALAFGLGWGVNGLFYYAIVRLHRDTPGAATGRAMSGALVGGLIGPMTFGWIVEAAGYRTAWGVAAVWAAIAVFGIAWGHRLTHHTRNA